MAVGILESQSPATSNIAGIGEIFTGPEIAQLFNPPGLSPKGDPRTPDIIVTPNIGVTYSGSSKKLAEHGGFAHDDVNVIMLVSNPGFSPSTVTSPVETAQIAPTILAELGLDPQQLEAVPKRRNPGPARPRFLTRLRKGASNRASPPPQTTRISTGVGDTRSPVSLFTPTAAASWR